MNPSSLATNLYFFYHPLPKIRIETKLQTDAFPYVSDFRNVIGLLEYLGESSTISLTLYNVKRESGRITIGFLQSFNNGFCAGAEMLTVWDDWNKVYTSVALAGRWVKKIFFESHTRQNLQFQCLCYHLQWNCLFVGTLTKGRPYIFVRWTNKKNRFLCVFDL